MYKSYHFAGNYQLLLLVTGNRLQELGKHPLQYRLLKIKQMRDGERYAASYKKGRETAEHATRGVKNKWQPNKQKREKLLFSSSLSVCAISAIVRAYVGWAHHCAHAVPISRVQIKPLPTQKLLFTCLLGVLPVAVSAQPYVISADGTEVTDQKTGLIWRRCAEGMVFSAGTCTGKARAFAYEAALQHAATQARSTGIAWRLPNIKELSSIANKSRSSPAIDPAAFPATPASWFWSASPEVGSSSYALCTSFNSGSVYSYYRNSNGYVRLVRAGH